MKKLFLLLIVIFATASGSFAWTGSQSLYAYGYQSGPYPGLTDTQGMTVNINSYCYDFELTGYVNTTYDSSSGMFAVASIYDSSTFESFYEYNYTNLDSSTYIYYRKTMSYWASVNVALETYLASMSVTLRWDAM